jgi:hypothetical protein
MNVKDFSCRYSCADDAADALLADLREHDLHAHCERMANLTGDCDYVAIDIFDGRERMVGWCYVSSDTGLYSFEFHSC